MRDIGEIEPLEKAREESALVHEALYGDQAVVGLEQDIAQCPQPYLLQRVAWSIDRGAVRFTREFLGNQSPANTLHQWLVLCKNGL